MRLVLVADLVSRLEARDARVVVVGDACAFTPLTEDGRVERL